LTTPGTIIIDRNAADYGWFVDRAPRRHEEFRPTAIPGEHRVINAMVWDQIDLMTVVEHELGHIAGLDDLLDHGTGLMADTLPVGIRRTVL